MTEPPQIIRRRSAIAGWGVYAGQTIEEDTPIVIYKGELISQAEAWRREQRYLPRQRIWIFTVNDRLARDAAVGGNIARFRRGEELTYDYNTDGVAGIQCMCRPGCLRVL